MRKVSLKNKIFSLFTLIMVTLSLTLLVSPTTKAFTGSDAEFFYIGFYGWGWHGKITDEALQDFGFSYDALERIKTANSEQDAIVKRNVSPWKPEYHVIRHYWYDEGEAKWQSETHQQAFYRGREYIKGQRDEVIKSLAQGNPGAALNALGRALHALQDFYAHSNFVDLTDVEQREAKTALIDPAQKALETLKIMSWERGAVFAHPEDDPLAYHHTNNHKDDEGQENFAAAKKAAVEQTKEFVAGIKEELEGEGKGYLWEALLNYSYPILGILFWLRSDPFILILLFVSGIGIGTGLGIWLPVGFGRQRRSKS